MGVFALSFCFAVFGVIGQEKDMVETASQVPLVSLVRPEEPPHPVALAGELICCNQPISPSNPLSAAISMGREHANIPENLGAPQHCSAVHQDLVTKTREVLRLQLAMYPRRDRSRSTSQANINFTTLSSQLKMREA